MHSERRTPKTLLTVSALAERAGLSAHIVRLYLRRGLMRASRRSSAGYQLFDEDDAERLRSIRVAQRLAACRT
jgi:DNA-binding transcriptional MerR regulator